jgi:hypothetical protein
MKIKSSVTLENDDVSAYMQADNIITPANDELLNPTDIEVIEENRDT